MSAALYPLAMHRHRTPPPAPTADHLHRAFERRRRADWPATLAEAQQVPLYAALIGAQARALVLADMATAAAQPRAHAPDRRGADGSTRVPTWRPPHQRAGTFDPRRAAANDRDDLDD